MADWEMVGRIKGEDGEKGEKGEKGDKGEVGNPLIIEGTLINQNELPTTGDYGQAFIIDGDLYVWK